jgi:uncharacterized protein (UPF0248 family)
VAVGGAAAALLSAPVRVLEVRHVGDGRLLWRVPVHAGSTVELHYTNSIYNAATSERFAVHGEALRLMEVSSTKEAVLEYMRLDSAYEQREGRYVARVGGPTLASFTTRIGQTGQQRLAVEGAEIPLHRIGVGEAATVALTRLPRLLVLWQRPSAP